MKVLLYGTCSFPYFFRELIQTAKKKGVDIEWSTIVRTWRHIGIYDGVLPPEKLFYIHPRINELMKQDLSDPALLASYPGSIFKDIIADKDMPGQLRNRPKEYQLKNAIAHYVYYKDLLQKEKPDFVFLPVVETHEGIVLFKTAVELGIKTISHTNARTIGRSIFSPTPYDDLPPHAFRDPVPSEFMTKAEQFIDQFVKNPRAPFTNIYDPPENDVVSYGRMAPMRKKIWKLPLALWNLVKDQVLEPHAARANPIWYQPHIQLWSLNLIKWRITGFLHRRYFDIFSVDALPPRFIYFPLHMTPELSMTTYAPYFEDQMRAIDLILMNMPSNCFLAVKEHPAMRGWRPVSFYKALRRKAGVLLVDSSVSGLELEKRSILTVAITGSAGFEAMFLSKPSMVLGNSLFSPWIPGIDRFRSFDETMRKVIAQPASDIRKRAIDYVARVFMVGHDFLFWDPHDVSYAWKYTMNYTNIAKFLDAFVADMNRADWPRGIIWSPPSQVRS